jgi:hypothetical protein
MSHVFHRILQGKCPCIDDTVFSDNPLLTPAIRANVRITDKCVLVPLLPLWPVLFRGVRSFGRVISFCGNSWAVMGSLGTYPEVWCTPCSRSARSGNLKFSFPCWSRAFVTIEEQSGNWNYSVEFLDAYGDVPFSPAHSSSDWVLEAYEPEGRLACAITPPRASSPSI